MGTPAEYRAAHATPGPGSPGTEPARPAEDEGRLTAAEERMWVLHRLAPDSPAYTVVSAVRVHGVLEPRILQQALTRLAERHAALRTTFVERDGRPVRRVASTAVPPFEVIDISGLPPGEAERARESHLRSEAERVWDLAALPAYRVALLTSGPNEHLLTVSFHHIVVDGWSIGVFHRDLTELYARSAGQADDGRLSDTVGSPLDAVGLERTYLAGPEAARDLDYWRRNLADASPLELPLARPRRTARSGSRGVRFEGRLAPEATKALEEAARSRHLSLFMIAGAAFAAVLHRYSGQHDIVFGSPLANRTDPELANALGLFVNSVVLRTHVRDDLPFADLATSFGTTVLDALEHQRLPFERLVPELAPDRTDDQNPLFQVMFALQNAGGAAPSFPGTRTETVRFVGEAVRLDLECTLWPESEGLRIGVACDTDVIPAEAAQQLLGHYTNVLDAVARDLRLPVGELPLLAADERDAVLAMERGSDSGALGAATVHGLWQQQVTRSPDAPAVSDPWRSLSFREVDERAGRLARVLAERGSAPGQVIGVCLERSVDLLVALLAVLRTGAAFLPLNPADPAERRRFVLRDASASIVLVDQGAEPAGTEGTVRVDITTTPAGEGSGGYPSAPGKPEDLAYVIYTSGTTGHPKGVQVEHRNLLNTLDACQREFGFGPHDTGLVIAAHTFDVFLYELLSPLLAGGQVRLVTTDELYDQERITSLLETATTFQAVPGVMEHLLTALGASPCAGPRLVMTGGDTVPSGLLGRLADAFPQAEIVVTYGPTETAVFCTAYRHRPATSSHGHPIGIPLPGTRVRVGDRQGRPLPVGVDGELWIGGAGVSRGYLNRPEETHARFRDLDDGRFYRSGDRARRLPTGELLFLGRRDRQVKVRGFRVELGEVESVLAQAPGVRAAVVLPGGEGASGRRLDAYVVPSDDVPTHPADEPSSRLAGAKTAQWRELFDSVYGSRGRAVHDGHDFTGWQSSYTGEPFPAQDMRDWLDGTLAAIRARFPRTAWTGRTLRVLEIGCGTGLLLRSLAPHCAAYLGTDFSPRAVADLRAHTDVPELSHVELRCLPADDPLPDTGDFDLVLINSVVQYFPDESYLRRVLDLALAKAGPRGCLFVGDVRSLPLLEPFHGSVLAHRGGGDAASVLTGAARLARDEEELTLHPLWFERWGATVGHPAVVEVEPRRGRSDNELTRFRYDVVVRRTGSAAADVPMVRWSSWSGGGWTTERVVDALSGVGDGTVLGLTGVPHGPLRDELRRHRARLKAAGRTAPDMAAGSAPDLTVLREAAASTGHRLVTSLYRGGTDGSFDAVFLPDGTRGTAVRVPWPAAADEPARLAGDPVRAARQRELAHVVQRHLADHLPSYLLPSTLSVLDALPLTANGKVDRKALPEPAAGLGSGGMRTGRRPLHGAARTAVAEVWNQVLATGLPDAHDDFFAVGGTSLLAIRLAVGLRARGFVLSPHDVFAQRTAGAMAALLDGRRGSQHSGDEQPAHDALSSRPTPLVATVTGVTRGVPSLPALPTDAWSGAYGILLTGATGMLGVHLLRELLERTDAPITCLVRAADDAAAEERLRAQYAWYFRTGDGPPLDGRVTVVRGDLSLPRLGWSEALWDEVADGCDHILHAAADVRHVADADEVFAANATGTRTLLDLAADRTPSRFHHVSTVGVAGRAPDGQDGWVLTEENLDIGQRPTEPYSASKIAAERSVRSFLRQGGHGEVFRIATVAPHFDTGRFQRNADGHFFGRYLRSTIELGIAVDWPDRAFDLLPADRLAKALLDLAGRPEADGHTFHLRNPHRLTHGRLVETLRTLGYPILLTDPEGFAAALADHGSDSSAHLAVGRLLPFLERPAGRPVRLDASWTDQWLRRLGIEHTRPTDSYIARFVTRGVADGYLPASRSR
ncbi:amino acid adenylation domain-containing protein [Streptomyces griseoviridis]|uniref:non-ribosomal peptide synthetase family protein n=1 Tax=Streptomyces griseoviridis TaxID=45398 RepID=UPI0033FD8F6F